LKIKPIISAIIISLIAFTSCTNNQLSVDEMTSLQLVKDELEIRALTEKFSDAANRKDGEQFQSLWAKDAVWKIGAPINMEFKGKENMGSSVTHMLGLWDFFVQLSGPGVVNINGDKATARFYVNEIARKADDKTGNYNLSMYEDELIKENGKWVFQKRTYNTIYQEAPNYTGLVQKLPISK
jgi:ketosteroid isomerase-like protein